MARPGKSLIFKIAISSLALALTTGVSIGAPAPKSAIESQQVPYGIVRTFITRPDQRENFVRALIEGYRDMPGCRSFIVATDPTDETTVWVTEIWDSRDRRTAEFETPRIKAAAARAKAFLDHRDLKRETRPVGGVGF
jgi:quinol monooxygenase YgiN